MRAHMYKCSYTHVYVPADPHDTDLCSDEGRANVERALVRVWNPLAVDADQLLNTLGQFLPIKIL